jgi:hypothetical protein
MENFILSPLPSKASAKVAQLLSNFQGSFKNLLKKVGGRGTLGGTRLWCWP